MESQNISQIKITEEENKQNNTLISSVPKDDSDNLNKINKKMSSTSIKLKSKSIYHKNDFQVISLLGKGAYAKVVKARYIKDNSIKAIKIIEKSFMEKVFNTFYYIILRKINYIKSISKMMCYGC
jgi:hypothetical protein